MAKATWPTRWLMTDERMGDGLFPAIERLPGGAGIVFRHHGSAPSERASLGGRIASEARARDLVLAVSRDADLAQQLGASLVHNPMSDCALPFSRSVHSLEEARASKGCSLAFVSPVAPTRSHPDAHILATESLVQILEALDVPAIALGGIDEERFAPLRALGFHGWAGIDAWLRT